MTMYKNLHAGAVAPNGRIANPLDLTAMLWNRLARTRWFPGIATGDPRQNPTPGDGWHVLTVDDIKAQVQDDHPDPLNDGKEEENNEEEPCLMRREHV